MSDHQSVFRSAITGSDGTVNPGYLGLYVVMMIVLGSIPGAFILAGLRMWIVEGHPLDLTGIAAIIAAAGVTFGTAAGGVGLFRMGDKEHMPTDTKTTTVVTPESVRVDQHTKADAPPDEEARRFEGVDYNVLTTRPMPRPKGRKG